MISSILGSYGLDSNGCTVNPLADGLINKTWKIVSGEQQFILQRINDHVFKRPQDVADNISMLNQHLKKHSPGYLFVAPLANKFHQEIVHDQEKGYFRLFPFIRGSHTINVVSRPDQAYEASLQFGKFTRLLSGFDATRLHLTIPDFHNLTLRYLQLEEAIKNGNQNRVSQCASLISQIKNHQSILTTFEKIKKNGRVRTRVTHNDTKISNVLFDDQDKGMCVIDLDTVMPGFFISDVGDMMRTYLSPANEEEKDFCKIEVRDDFFMAIVQGYLLNMNDDLTEDEKDLIHYAGLFLIYMQAIRFLADYCNNDAYYGAHYEEQNFVRAGNQLALLQRLAEKKEPFERLISKEFKTRAYSIKE